MFGGFCLFVFLCCFSDRLKINGEKLKLNFVQASKKFMQADLSFLLTALPGLNALFSVLGKYVSIQTNPFAVINLK